MYYNEKIAHIREDRGISQKELAKMVGLSPQQYNKYENGIVAMPISLLIKICRALDVSSDYVLNLSDFKKSYSFVSDDHSLYKRTSLGVMVIDSSKLREIRSFAESINVSLDDVLSLCIDYGFDVVKRLYEEDNNLFKE